MAFYVTTAIQIGTDSAEADSTSDGNVKRALASTDMPLLNNFATCTCNAVSQKTAVAGS